MKTIAIHHKTTRAVLFEGPFPHLRAALEAAISAGTSLAGAALRGAQLSNAALDGADLRGCDLTDATLMGANLSECDVTGAVLAGTDLTAACLAESRLRDVDFTGASFAGTILTGAVIEGCVFSCPTALGLDFASARTGRNTYIHDGCRLAFSAPPVVITGLPKRVVFLDDTVLVGNDAFPHAGLPDILQVFYPAAGRGEGQNGTKTR